jgi:Zn-dependent protease with chaperone function
MKILETVQFLGSPVLIAALVSTLVGIALRLTQTRLFRLAPAAHSQLVMAAAVCPPICAFLFLASATFGWFLSGDQEICLRNEHSEHISIMLIIACAVILARGAIWGFRIIRDIRQFRRIVRNSALSDEAGGCRILLSEEPQVFVSGIWKPVIYISNGLLSKFGWDGLRPMLAHEQAHVRHRHPLQRLVASACLLFHMPGIAGFIKRLLSRTQEMAADAEAASQLENPIQLAESLVRFARLQLARRASVFEFASSDVELRVRQILERDAAGSNLSLASLLLCGITAAAITFAVARQLHLAAEFLLQLP